MAKQRIMPHDLEAEAGLLSCIILDASETLARCVEAGVGPDSFYDPKHAIIYNTALSLHTRQQPVDVSVIATELKANKQFEAIGGYPFLVQVTTLAPTTAQAAYFVEHVKTLAALRKAIETARQTAETAYGWKGGAEEMEQWLFRQASSLTALYSGSRQTYRSLKDIASEAIQEAEEEIAGTAATRPQITTGLATFDRYAMPIERHEYVVVGARTSHGKSSLLLQIAGHNLAQGKRVAIFTLETSDKSVVKQIAGQRAGVNLRRLDSETREKQQDYLAKLRAAQAATNLIVFDRDLSLGQIESRCRLLKASYKPDLVIIDYLGIIGVGGDSSIERMTRVSAAMIPLTKNMGCPVMVGCQLNRSSEKEERAPTRTDFRDSGSIEQDAHRLICIWRKPGQFLDAVNFDCQLLQLKLRDGPTACVDLKFHSPTTRFFEEAKA